MIVAHMGMPEYDEFLGFAARYDNVRVDTTMCFTDFTERAELGRQLAPRLADLQSKVLLGTDFPNIPHHYAHQLEALVRTGLDDAWLRAVCWDNAAELFRFAPLAS
jgi:predicted TIM-barrel fold metal-dependent hydrolase